MSFSLPRFLRRTPPKSLKQYFAARRVDLPGDFDWNAPQSALLAALRQAIDAFDDAARERIITDFERVHQLCDAVGQLALQSIVTGDDVLLSRLRAAESDEGRALIVLLDNDVAFDRALAVSYADHRRNGRAWSGYSVADGMIAANSPENLQALETEISGLLRHSDGTGRRLKIEYFERQSQGTDGSPLGSTTHYSIYAEGLPQSDLEFERDGPKRRTRRPVHEGAISYNPGRCLLDVVAKGGRPVRRAIAQAYARHVLGFRDELTPIVLRLFALDRLKQPIEFPTEPADGVKSVRVILLRLSDMVGGYGRVTIETDDSERTDIHATSAKWFGDFDPLQRPEWRVTAASLRIVFFAEKAGRRDKTITVELRRPNGSNLREHIRHHQIISERCLARWGLVAEGTKG